MIWRTIAGRCIHRGSNGLQVRQNLIYRWLTFDSPAIQTLLNYRHPERFGLNYINALTLPARTHPAPSCLLGLGGAGIAHALAPCFGDIQLDAIEHSLEVIEISSRYFMTDQLKNLHIIHQDAVVHVHHTTSRYQHLMIDLFNAHSFPEHCNNNDFFMNCKRLLLPHGVLAVNLANLREHWSVFMNIRDQFQQCTVCIPIKGTANVVVLAYKGASIKPLLSLLENNHPIKKLTWDSQWGCVAQFK